MASLSRPFGTLFAALLLMAAAAFCGMLFIPGLNTADRPTGFTVHRGMGFMEIAGEMQRKGAIRNQWQTIIAGRAIPGLHNIKPGRYTVPPGLSNYRLLRYLYTHPQDEVRVTIPEGLELREIARLLSSKLDMDSAGFMAAVRDPAFLGNNGISDSSAEGYLFPGTYNFAWSDTPKEAAGFLVRQFRKFYSDSLKSIAASKGFTEKSLLTLASIVEAETPLDEEKPVVASVYLNRLKKNMRLQADPTVQYALGGEYRLLYYKDLAVDSPYNTYLHPGLPPGPICNPGAASIKAVLNPAETGYLYFVATGKGGHYFASTLAGHAENVRKYREARKSATE
ncbi:MAG: endolytic transglycosylase MltG [Chlorobium sp.]|uniref:endolytic transglycosylase MltG n=1 Tax=Chlorobium sp. TaxID=1095 RepID=UPI002F3E403E